MRKTLHALLLVASVTGTPALAAEPNLATVEALGKSIFEHDRAAWLATDRVLESRGSLPEGVRGWVTAPSDGGLRVVFVQEDGDVHCSTLSVLVNAAGAGPLRQSEACVPLTADQRAMFLARQTAISALRTRCSEAYNTVVFPQEGKEGAWSVYLLAATKDAGKVVVGGHVRVLVGGGGREVLDYAPLSNSCLVLEWPQSGAAEQVEFMTTHVLHDHPIETHVFLSLLHRRTFIVVTESALWSVDKGKIELLMDGEEFKAYMNEVDAANDKP